MREMKIAPQHIKAISGRAVTGLFSVFGNIDSYGDIVTPGAFTKTFSDRGGEIFHLWQHDFESPAIAVVKDLRELRQDELPDSVKSSHPDATGGAEVTREYLDTPRGNEIMAGLNAGVPYKMSFAFDPVKIAMTEQDDQKVRLLREVRIYETSDVLWGANDATVASKGKQPTTKAITRALRNLKASGADLWEMQDECYDLSGGASAFASVAYLLGGECDSAESAAPLIAALRMLLTFLDAEISDVEALIAAGQSADMQMNSIAGLERQIKALLKAGARHSDADMKRINAMHDMAVELGATNCAADKADTAPEESRAEPVSLTLEKARLFILNY